MKFTIAQIDQLIDNFECQVSNIMSKSSFDAAKKDLLNSLKSFQLEDPVLIPYSVGNDIKDILKSISVAAESRQELQVVYAGGGSCKLVQGICIDNPMFTDLSSGFHILIKPFDSTNMADTNKAEHTLNQYLLNTLLSYPRGSVRVNFVDPNFVGIGDAFVNTLGKQGDASICRLLQDRYQIENCLMQEMSKRIADINQQGDRYYMNNPRYELVVMVNIPSSYQNVSNQLNMLLNKGAQYGIQLVLLHDINTPAADYNTFDVLSRKDLFTVLDNDQEMPNQPAYIHYSTNLFAQENVFEACLDYLKNGLEEENDNTNAIAGYTPIPPIMDTADPEQYFKNLEKVVSKNVILPAISYNTYQPLSRGNYKICNNKIPWQVEGNKKQNIVINYTWQSEDRAIDLLNQIAMNMLLSLPVTKVHFTLINYNKDPWARFLDKNIDNRIVDVIYEANRVPLLYSTLSKKLEDDSDQLGCSLERKNLEDGAIYRPYEIIVMSASDADSRGELMGLFRNGADSGIYFIIMNNTQDQAPHAQGNGLLSQTPFIHVVDADADCYRDIPLDVVQQANIFSRHPSWTAASTRYINDHSVVKIHHDWNAIIEAPYPETSPNMSAIIGYEQGTGTPVEYKLDISNSHYHSFVIGGTGSGKTTFLHNIILSLALKYRPEDLELYLIDLKGPEFGRYRQLLQAGAILVDKTDDLITYEVVGNLVRKMIDRKEILSSCGGDLAKYNKLHPNAPLPQVLLIVDECQNLYKTNSENQELAKKIVDSITMIATEGRAFGIHLLMATQSLNNCPLLDAGVLTQFQDFWILPCVDTDAKMLVKAEHKDIVGQEADRMEREKTTNRGQCFLQGTDGYRRFKFNYISDDKRNEDEQSQVEQFIQKSIEKAAGHISNGQVFFSGSQHYSLYNNVDKLISPNRNNLIASAGQNISFAQDPNLMHLISEQGQNILTMGYNDQQFVTRTSIDILLSLVLSSRKNGLGYRFLVINCLGQDGAEYSSLLQRISADGYCELIEPKDSGEKLKSLCAEIANHCATPTILTILCQEKFNYLKNNDLLPAEDNQSLDHADSDTLYLPGQDDIEGSLDIIVNGLDFDVPQVKLTTPKDIKTYRDAVYFILQNGPENRVHTLLQINKSSELAISNKQGYASMDKTDLYKLFGHIVFLQTDKDTESFFSLYDLHLHEIQESENRLRAYYYNPNGGSSQLFSPYVLPMKRIQKGVNSFKSILDIEATINEITRNY